MASCGTMQGMIDLHMHSCYSSDGVHQPEELVAMARASGITAVAVTDHNETGANVPAAAAADRLGIAYVRGVELNSYFEGRDVHILGYHIDPDAAGLRRFLDDVRSRKAEQTRQRCLRLQALGFRILLADVERHAAGRPATGVSFLKALLDQPAGREDRRLAPYLSGEKRFSPFMHFYSDWFKPGCPAFVEVRDAPSAEACRIINESGGVAVIAHPCDLDASSIRALRDVGASGIEVYTSYHPPGRVAFYEDVASKLGMCMTAGSDFHGESIKKNVRLGEWGGGEHLLAGLDDAVRKLHG